MLFLQRKRIKFDECIVSERLETSFGLHKILPPQDLKILLKNFKTLTIAPPTRQEIDFFIFVNTFLIRMRLKTDVKRCLAQISFPVVRVFVRVSL